MVFLHLIKSDTVYLHLFVHSTSQNLSYWMYAIPNKYFFIIIKKNQVIKKQGRMSWHFLDNIHYGPYIPDENIGSVQIFV